MCVCACVEMRGRFEEFQLLLAKIMIGTKDALECWVKYVRDS